METLAFRAVIFDMDGLLIDSERLSYQSYAETAKRHGLGSDFEPYQAMIGLNAVEGLPILQSILPASIDAAAFKDEWVRGYRALLDQNVPVKPFAKALVSRLNEAGIAMAVATSSRGEKARDVLSRAGIMDKLVAVTGGNEVPRGKPAPDVYLASIAKLAAADPTLTGDHCIAFEDSDVGVTAALDAGLRVIQIPDMVPPRRAVAAGHRICADLSRGAALLGLSL